MTRTARRIRKLSSSSAHKKPDRREKSSLHAKMPSMNELFGLPPVPVE
jgi:hypothetical protein